MKKPLLFTLFLSIFSFYSQAQDSGFLPGYIVTNSNDTIQGLVKYVNQVPYHVLVNIKFKESRDAKSKVYSPSKIKGYMAEDKIFHSLKTSDGSQFMELIIDGNIRLYRLTVTSFGVSQYGNNNTVSDYLLKSGEKNLFAISRWNFKNDMSAYLADNSSLSEKIKNKEYKIGDIEEIITEYNSQKEND